jgi:hypothetical protein
MVNYNTDFWVMCNLNNKLNENFKFLGFETSDENKQDTQQDRQCTYNGTSRRIRATVVSVEKL